MSEESTVNSRLRLSHRAALAGGQPIGALMHQALAYPDLISLAAGFVDQATLPVEPTRRALEIILSDPDRARTALQYGSTPGFVPLREALLARLRQADGDPSAEAALSIDQVVITAGSNQLLHLLCETLMDPGDIVLCTSPSYFVFLGLLANLGLRSVGVEMDQDGMSPEALDETLARLDAAGELARVKAIYCCTYFDNPTSVTLALGRRARLVELARKWSRHGRILILEDVAYRELRYEGDDLPSLRAFDESGDMVVQAGTFSKAFAPGVRVGWGVLPADLVRPLCEHKGNIDFGSPNLAQHVMHAVLAEGLLDPHIARLRENYRRKLAAMLSAAKESLGTLPGVGWTPPQGGLYVWLTLPETISAGLDGKLIRMARDAGVLYVPGESCYPAEGPRRSNTVRLSFGVQPVDRIRQGIAALAEAIAELI